MQFGDAVQVEYVDLADPENGEVYTDLLGAVQEQSLPYPLVAIDGQLRLAGSAHYFQVLPLVEKILEPELQLEG
jgi:disulfide oxidoreductase YuzD